VAFFSFEGQSIYYIDQGHGTPMLFLHNGGTDQTIWQKQFSTFLPNHRVLALDWPGCGLSDRPNRPYDLSLYLQLLKKFIEDLRLQQLILVGSCVGASTALEFACLFPQSVKSLILFNVFGGTATIPSLK